MGTNFGERAGDSYTEATEGGGWNVLGAKSEQGKDQPECMSEDGCGWTRLLGSI